MSLIMVGSIALDTIEAPAGRVEDVLGGTAIYASLAASHFTKPGVVAVVGEDFPAKGRNLLEAHTIDLRGLQVAPGKTFRWGGRYAENFNDRVTLFTDLNVFESFQPELPQNYRNSDFVFLGNIHPGLQRSVLEQMTAKPFVGLDTMNLWINIAPDELKALLKSVDLLLVNDEESLMLTGERHLGRAAHLLMEMGPQWVVIKKGSHGAVLFHGTEVFSAPALILDDVIDPTGAGDSFAGGLMGYLASRGEVSMDILRRAVIQGSVLASFCVEDFSVNAMDKLDQEALANRYEQFVEMVRF